MDGAAGIGLRMTTLSRAAHRALHTSAKHRGIRADRRPVWIERHFTVENSADDDRQITCPNVARYKPATPPSTETSTAALNRSEASPPPTRDSGIRVRKTPRKPRKAARAAGTRRAPPPPPTPR